MKKPVIGILPLIDDEKESWWMLPGYPEGVAATGGLPLMLPVTADREMICQMAEICDGFLFTGGHDVSPELYQEERLSCVESSSQRDEMETCLFRLAYEKEKPILGICRGIQFINVMMGGTLWQDLPSQRPFGAEHHQRPPYDVPTHKVRIEKDSPLYELLADLVDPQGGLLEVNSYHHQAVKDLGDDLTVMAVSEDGLVEGICDRSKRFLWAVQWHPEFSWKSDESSRRIFEEFVRACAHMRHS